VGAVATVDKVKQAHAKNAAAHRKAHEDAILAAAVKKAETDAYGVLRVPQIGLQGDDGDFWEVGEE
jgi:hypothetical protein